MTRLYATGAMLDSARAARSRARAGDPSPTSGVAAGVVQANLIAVPADWAFDVLLFGQRNPKPCPIIDVVEAGGVESALAPGSDLRTDLPRYRIWRDGELVDEPTDVRDAWAEHPDLVAVLIGCSFTFEAGLAEADIPIRHQDLGRNVPMYRTGVECTPAGRLRGRQVVSMRPIPADRVADAVRISGQYPSVHGAPVHIGDPASLGIRDLAAPDYGDPPAPLEPGDVPVFWACGVTPQSAIVDSRPPFAITHAPGCMFVTDLRNESYAV